MTKTRMANARIRILAHKTLRMMLMVTNCASKTTHAHTTLIMTWIAIIYVAIKILAPLTRRMT